jgi:hypothetical protein
MLSASESPAPSAATTRQRIGALDLETDPFRRGAAIEPFAWGLLWEDGEYEEGWGDDCLTSLAAVLEASERAVVYAHNGGRFDFVFMAPFLSGDALIIDGRIASATIGAVELRDSYMILPHALSEMGAKDVVDFKYFARGRRDAFKPKIQKYLKQDCTLLLNQVLIFRGEFGNSMSVSSAATVKLNKAHKRDFGKAVERLSLADDRFFRRFYFGGRTAAFERGDLRDDWLMYDMRSAFSAVMRDELHPTSNKYMTRAKFDGASDFVTVDATSRGSLPVRNNAGDVEYPVARGIFHVTAHELRAVQAAGLVDIHKVVESYTFSRRENFAGFVDEFGRLRLAAISAGDETQAQHYKNILNRAYGKQALDVETMGAWRIEKEFTTLARAHIRSLRAENYTCEYTGGGVSFWKRPLSWIEKIRMVRNVACGASITGAARARLASAIQRADRPIYCDTDGIIARALDVRLSDQIGGWRIIERAARAAIAAPKTYALFDQMGLPVKYASKGARLNPAQILRLVGGEDVSWYSDSPTYSPASHGSYVARTFEGLRS